MHGLGLAFVPSPSPSPQVPIPLEFSLRAEHHQLGTSTNPTCLCQQYIPPSLSLSLPSFLIGDGAAVEPEWVLAVVSSLYVGFGALAFIAFGVQMAMSWRIRKLVSERMKRSAQHSTSPASFSFNQILSTYIWNR